MEIRSLLGMIALMLALMVAISGCTSPDVDEGAEEGDEEDDETPPEPAPPEPMELAVSTAGNYPVDPGFDPGQLEVVAGANVTVVLTNEDLLAPHAWEVEGVSGSQSDTAEPGEMTSVTFTAPEPGEYEFFCPVGNHRDLGQVGTLTVVSANGTS